MKIGVIGVRNNGCGHIRNIQAIQGAEICAIADTDEARLATCGNDFGITELYRDGMDIINDDKIDAVILSVPNSLHAPLAIKAMEAGKHVYVEKPISLNSDQARKMIETKNKTGQILMVGMNYRFKSEYTQIKNEISKGIIGDIQYVRAYFNRMQLATGPLGRGSWQWNKGIGGGGPLMDIGVHVLDLTMYLLGFPEIDRVFGITTHGIGCQKLGMQIPDYNIEDMCSGIIVLRNGTAIHLESSFFLNDTKASQRITICGTKGGVENQKYFINKGDEIEYRELNPNFNNSSAEAHFVNVICGQEELSSTPEQALVIMQIVEALYKSAEIGESIKY